MAARGKAAFLQEVTEAMAMDDYFVTRGMDDVLIVKFQQPQILDAVTIERMGNGLKQLIDGAAQRRFLLDFSNVTYLSSSALGIFISFQRRVVQKPAELKLSGICDGIMEVFRITKLDTVFDIYKDAPSAVEAFRKNA